MALCFLALTELFFRLLGSYGFLIPVVLTGLLGSIVGSVAKPPAAGAIFMLAAAYVVPALLSWLVLKTLRARSRLPAALPGKYLLVLGLLCSFVGHIAWLSPKSQALPWLLASLHWLPILSTALLVVGLTLATRSLKRPSAEREAKASSAT